MGKQNRDAAPTSSATLEDVVRDGLGGIKEVMKKKTEDVRDEKTKDADRERADAQKAIADEHLKRFETVLDGVARKVDEDIRSVNERVDGIHQRLQDDAKRFDSRKSPAVIFRERAEAHETMERWRAGKLAPGQRIDGLPSIYTLGRRDDEEIIVAGDVGDAVPQNYRIPGIQQYYQHEYGLAEILFAMGQAETSKTAEWIKETETGEGAHIAVECKADPQGKSSTPTDSIEIKNTDTLNSFVVGSYVKVVDKTGTMQTVGPIDSVSTTEDEMSIDFDSSVVDFDIDVGTKIFSTVSGAVAELGAKPYGTVEFEKATETMKMLPIMGAVTRNQLMDVVGLMSYIQLKMKQRALRNLSWHLIYGDGSKSDQLSGFTTETDAQTLSWSDLDDTSSNRLDAILYGLDKILSPGVASLVMRKDTFRKIGNEKDSDSRYLHSREGIYEFSDMGPGRRNIGPYPVIIDQTVAADYVICVDLANASKMFYHPMGGAFMTGWKNDDFEKNIIRVRYEDYLAHGIVSTQSYVTVYLDAQPT